MLKKAWLSGFILLAVAACSAHSPEAKVFDLTAQDGTKLKATYFGAGKQGPGLLLLHQCNRDRSMWNDLAPKLAASGFNVLTVDFRGFGESDGTPISKQTPQEAAQSFQKFPSDVDAAFAYLTSQPGVVRSNIGAAGASCGVNQSIQLARRHPEVKSLVLLSGPTDRNGRMFLKGSPNLPLFGAAADDDPGAVDQIEWILSMSANPGNVFHHYTNGGHGIEMFAPHPELSGLIVDWFNASLISGKVPPNPAIASLRQSGSVLNTLDSEDGAAKVSSMLSAARTKDPKAQVFPEADANVIGYEHLQAGDVNEAIEIFKLNVTAYPNSPNTYDSLADAYVAAGDKEQARKNAQKAIDLLAGDTQDPEARKQAIRQSAEQKLK